MGNPPPELESIKKEAELELGPNNPAPFSSEGFERLKQRIADYIGELTAESVRVARRHQSDTVSPAYVDRAAEHLASGKSHRWQKIIEGLGAIILGIGLATAGSMIQLRDFSTRGVIISIVCILLGMPAFMFHIMKD